MSVNLGGRLFDVMNMAARPFRVDAAQVALLQELGLDRTELLPESEEDPVAYIMRLNAALIATQRIPDLLGHYLLPIGKTEADWSPAMARETAAWVEALTSEVDRVLVYELAGEFVFGFFRKGVALLSNSRSFLLRVLEEQATLSPSESTAAPSTSARGPASFGRWLGTITRGRSRSASGPSARA